MRVLSLAVLLFIYAITISCNPNKWAGTKWRIWCENRSEKEVYFVIGLDFVNGKYRPTTLLPNDSTNMRLVKPNGSSPIDYSMRKVECPDGAPIAFFILDPDTVAKYTWDQLRHDENYIKKYESKCGSFSYRLTYP